MANDTKFKDKIIKVFGMEVDDENQVFDDEFYDDEYEDVPEDNNWDSPAPAKQKSASQSAGKSRGSRGGYGMVGGPEVLVLEPERFEDAPGLVNKIKENKTIVVNLKNTEFEEGKKIFDFLNGAVFALEGSINKIAQNVFILAPKQVFVSTAMDHDDMDIITPILDFDEQ